MAPIMDRIIALERIYRGIQQDLTALNQQGTITTRVKFGLYFL